MVMLSQDAVLPCKLPLKKAFCSSNTPACCMYQKWQKWLITYGPAMLTPFFSV